MKKIIVNIVNKVLSTLFPYKEPDGRGEYAFDKEGWTETLFRNGNIDKYKTYKI
jgi:hypothetical protein